MPKRLPIKSAADFGQKHQCTQVIIAAWDGERTHIVTWGRTLAECKQAADGGNKIKDALGWPKDLHAEPSRIAEVRKSERVKVATEVLAMTDGYEWEDDILQRIANRILEPQP